MCVVSLGEIVLLFPIQSRALGFLVGWGNFVWPQNFANGAKSCSIVSHDYLDSGGWYLFGLQHKINARGLLRKCFRCFSRDRIRPYLMPRIGHSPVAVIDQSVDRLNAAKTIPNEVNLQASICFPFAPFSSFPFLSASLAQRTKEKFVSMDMG